MDKPFYMMPCAGLANRIRSMVSAMCTARVLGRQLRVLWRYEPNICTIPFHLIFGKVPEWMVVEDIMGYPTHMPWKEIFTEEDWNAYMADREEAPLYIKSHQAFYKKGWTEMLHSLNFHDTILKEVDRIMENKEMVGVHIRRTDHRKSIENSPSGEFWKEMELHETRFYLATDDMEERVAARERFGERVVFGPTMLLGRNSPDGCWDAMVDMICLSRCSLIIGSYASSFSEVAAAIGNIPLKIAAFNRGCRNI
jgi:hypothetical protein